MFEIKISKEGNEQTNDEDMMFFFIQNEDSVKAVVNAITDAMMKERRSTAFRMEE